MCQETPSTTRWWATSSSRPCRSGSAVEEDRLQHPAGVRVEPGDGLLGRRRIASGSMPSTVVRRAPRRSRSTSCDHSIGAGRLSRSRSASCRATRASSAAAHRAAVAPAGVRSRSAWCRRSMPPPSSASRCTIGSRPPRRRRRGRGHRRPAAGLGLGQRGGGALHEDVARGDPHAAALARLTSWIATMLSPPSAKKSPSAPDRVQPEHLGEQRRAAWRPRAARRRRSRPARSPARARAGRPGRACR